MKKIMNVFVLVAAAAMALVSCQKNEFETPAQKELHFTVKAGVPQTKTSITDNGDKTYTPSWTKGDQIGVFFADPAKDENLTTTFENTADAGIVATFEGKASATDEGILYSFYPKSAFSKAYGDGTIRLDLETSQKPTSTSFDPACDILVAQPCMYMSDGTEVLVDDMHFARIMSVLKINLNTTFADIEDEVVESISFGVAGVDIAGNAVVDYKTAEIKGWNNGTTARNVLTATYTDSEYISVAGTNNAAYFVVAPVNIPAGKTLTFTIKTQNYNISKVVTSPEMSFAAGKVEVINLTIGEDNCEAIEIDNDTRIWVEGFDGETTNKTQTTAANSGAIGTGVTSDLKYSYSTTNCNIRINSNGQTSTNPFLYINAANSSFTASKIKIANENNLSLSAKVKGNGLKLTVEYKESSATTWTNAGVINGGSSYVENEVIFAVANTATSIDIRLTGNGVMYVDDIVLASTDASVPVVTLASIAVTGQKTTFTVGDTFVFGGTVTATYSNSTTSQVTPTSVSTPEMTEGEHTVTVTYVEEGITKTVEYTIQVNPAGSSAGEVLLSENFSSLTAWSTTDKSSLTINGKVWTRNSGKMYEQNGCIKFGSGTATTNTGIKLPKLTSVTGTKNVRLTFKAVSSAGAYTLSVSATGATVGTLSPSAITKYSTAINSGATTASALAAAFASAKEFSVDITGVTSSTEIVIKIPASAKQWYIDDVKVVTIN